MARNRNFGKNKKRPKTTHRKNEGRKNTGADKKWPDTGLKEVDRTNPTVIPLKADQPNSRERPAKRRETQ